MSDVDLAEDWKDLSSRQTSPSAAPLDQGIILSRIYEAVHAFQALNSSKENGEVKVTIVNNRANTFTFLVEATGGFYQTVEGGTLFEVFQKAHTELRQRIEKSTKTLEEEIAKAQAEIVKTQATIDGKQSNIGRYQSIMAQLVRP